MYERTDVNKNGCQKMNAHTENNNRRRVPTEPLRTSRWWVRTLAMAGLIGAGICGALVGCNNGDTLEKTQKTVTETSNKPTDKTPANPSNKTAPGGEVPDTIYPGVPFMNVLTPQERKTLVRVVDAELCPCPGATESLHKCLQKEAAQCPLALQSLAIAAQSIKEGQSEKDALKAMGEYVQAAYKKYTLDVKGIPYKGNPKAKVVLVEFADFECPFCNQAREIVKSVQKEHGDNMVFYFKHFPLSFHKNSTSAAAACTAAHKQGRFWELYELLFDNQKILSDPKIEHLAETVGLNMDKFRADWKSPEVLADVKAQLTEGRESGVDSTPTFFINGKRYLGEKTPEALSKAVGDALKK